MRHAFRVSLLPKPLHPSGKDSARLKAKSALANEGGEAPGDEATVVDDFRDDGTKRSVLHVKAPSTASRASLVSRMKQEFDGATAERIEYHVCRHDESPPQPCGPWEVV